MTESLSITEKSDLFESLINDNIDGMIYQFHQNMAGEFSIRYISDGVKDLYNVSPENVKYDISCLFTCIHPDDIKQVNQTIKDSYVNNTNWDCKYRIIINGSKKFLHGRSKIQKHDDGTATWNGVVLDITNQQQSIDHLYKHNRLLNMVTNNISDIIIELDISGNVLKIAPSVYNHLGYQKEELENQPYINFIHSDDRTKVHKNRAICFRNPDNVISQQIRFLHKNGQEVILDTCTQALTDPVGNVKGIIGVSRNITSETLNQKLANELATFVETGQANQALFQIIKLLKTQLPKSLPYILDFNLNTNKLTHLVSDKNLHSKYKKLLEEGIDIGQNVLACGAAVFKKQHIHIKNVMNHPNFINRKQIMKECNVKTCSAYPIISKNNDVLGTLSFYFMESILLTKNQIETIDIFLPYIGSILAHRKQEQALTSVNTHYHQSQQVSQTGSWEWNLLDNSVWWSDQTYCLFEVNQHSFKVSFEGLLNLLTDESCKQVKRKAEKILENGKEYSVILKLKSNPKKIILGYCYLIKDSLGNNLKLLGTVKDVTNEEMLKQEISEKYNQLNLVNKNAPGMVYQFKLAKDGVMSFPFISEGAKDIYGLLSEEIMESPLKIINMHHPDDAEKFHNSISESAKSLRQWDYEGRIIVNSHLKWIKGRSNPIKQEDGSIIWSGVVIDITKEKELENQIETVTNNIEGVVYKFRLTASGEMFMTYVSNGITKLLGYSASEIMVKTSDFFKDGLHKNSKGVFMNSINNSDNHLISNRITFQFKHKNGLYRWMHSNSTSQRCPNGDMEWQGVMVDVTKEQELLIVNTNLSRDLTQLIDTANAPIFGIDVNGNVNEWNLKAAEITGYSKSEVLGMPFVETYITNDYKQSVGAVLDNALKGNETANYEVPIFTKKNQRRMILLNATTKRNKDGYIIGVVGVGQDITELDNVRKDLTISNIRWQSMIKNEKISITEVDLNLNITFCSGILKSLHGLFNVKQIIGSSPLNFEVTHKRKVALTKKINHLKKTGEYFTDITEVQYNNITITIQNQWFPVYENDKITSYAIISTDITEQVQLEADKRESERALEEALIQQKVAEEKNRLKSDFLANMSHELRTPLNSIMGYAQLLRMKESLTEKQSHYLNEMYQGSQHLLNLINGLLDLSKIEAGQMKFEPSIQPVSELMGQIIHTVTPILEKFQQTIQLSLDASSSSIFTDPTMFHQIMLNLLSNSIKFSPSLSIITIETYTESNDLLFKIKDQGSGIPEDLKGQLFDRFTQDKAMYRASLDNNPDIQIIDKGMGAGLGTGSGTGLGLALCKSLIALHGGSIWLDETYTDGACFCFTLPIKSYGKIKV